MQSVVTDGTGVMESPRGGRNLYRAGIRITVPPRHARKKRNQTGYRGKALLYIRKRGEIVAKDGTARGGPRTGSGRKSKGLAEKLAEGNPGGRKLTVMELPDGAQLRGEDMPEPGEYLKAKQRQGGEFAAENIYRDTWNWLKERGCEKLVSKQLIEQYAMSVSRWIQCENAISEYGFLSKHPTTGAACASPYVVMSQNYQKQTNQLWYQIFQVVKENCSSEYQGATPQDDVMELLLRTKRG